MKIHILVINTVTERMLKQLNASFQVHHLKEIDNLDQWIAEHGHDIQGIITNGHDGVDDILFTALSNLKVISCFGVGYDAINVEEATKRGVLVSHTPDVLNADVANMAILLLLATTRNLIRDEQWLRSGKWASHGNAPLTRSIEGKTIGLVGLGRIGQTIAAKLDAAFDCHVVYHTRQPKDVPFTYYKDLLKMAEEIDIMIIITPGGPGTHHLIDKNIINALGPEGTLINVARGSVIDQDALISALVNGNLGWAGLDVFADEPNVPQSLIELDHVVLTPHVASATLETRQSMGDLTVDNLLEYFKTGQVKTPVPECMGLNKAL